MDKQKEETIEVEGVVTEVLPLTMFRVTISKAPLDELKDRSILGHLSGKLRKNYIKILEGDRVRLVMTPKYDLDKGRITYRL